MTPIILWFLTRNVVTAEWRYYPGQILLTKCRSDRRQRRMRR